VVQYQQQQLQVQDIRTLLHTRQIRLLLLQQQQQQQQQVTAVPYRIGTRPHWHLHIIHQQQQRQQQQQGVNW
jgi:hypothetical protein